MADPRGLCRSSLTLIVLPFLFPLIAMVKGSLAGEGWQQLRGGARGARASRGSSSTASIIAAGVIVLVYGVTMMAAFGFAKLHIRFREFYFWLLLACLTLPEVVLLTPAVRDGDPAGHCTTRTGR